jgi:hypothetical protein
VIWASRESNPIPDVDTDTQKPEVWCYIALEHLENRRDLPWQIKKVMILNQKLKPKMW